MFQLHFHQRQNFLHIFFRGICIKRILLAKHFKGDQSFHNAPSMKGLTE